MTSTHSLWQFIRREPVLSISFVCALVSAFFVPPSAAYVDYIDLRVLCLLFCLMAVVAGLQECGLFLVLAQRLLAGELDFLLEREEPLLAELYHKLRGSLLAPRTAVCYDREAFLYAPGNVRITLDRDVRTGLSPLDFLRPERFSLKPLSGLTVLEVKYDAFLPDLVRMAVQIPNRRAAACSKYALCRRYD